MSEYSKKEGSTDQKVPPKQQLPERLGSVPKSSKIPPPPPKK